MAAWLTPVSASVHTTASGPRSGPVYSTLYSIYTGRFTPGVVAKAVPYHYNPCSSLSCFAASSDLTPGHHWP